MSQVAPARREEINEHTRWNFGIIATESTFFMSGLAWVDPSAVLPLFVAHLTPSTIVIGIIAWLQQVGWKLPQVFMAPVLGHRPNRLPFLRWPVLVGRLPFLLFVAYLWLRGIEHTSVVLGFLAIGYGCVSLGNGVLGISWHDIIAKSIPSWLRGRFFGTMQFAQMGAAFLVGFGVRWVLGPGGPGYPQDYRLLFTMMAIFITLSTIGCWLVREPIRPVLERPQSLWEMLGSTPSLLRKKTFGRLVLTGLLGFVVLSAMPFYVVFAKEKLGVPDETAGIYIWGMTMGGALASLLWGYMNDRCGPRSVLRGASLFTLATPLLAIVIPSAFRLLPSAAGSQPALQYVFALVFLAGGSTSGAMWMGTTNYLFELCGHADRPRYLAIYHLCTLPGTLGALLTGWLLNLVAFTVLFALLATVGAAMVAVSLRLPHVGDAQLPECWRPIDRSQPR